MYVSYENLEWHMLVNFWWHWFFSSNYNSLHCVLIHQHYFHDLHAFWEFKTLKLFIQFRWTCLVKMYCFSFLVLDIKLGERGGSVVECRTPEREVGGSKPTAAVLCPWARHFTPRKYWLITQEAVAPSRHDWKIVDWDVKPQHKQKRHQIKQIHWNWSFSYKKVHSM